MEMALLEEHFQDPLFPIYLNQEIQVVNTL